jgi:hypothetical protein
MAGRRFGRCGDGTRAHRRAGRTMRSFSTVALAGLLLAACGADPRAGGDAPSKPPTESTRLDAYEAVLRHLHGADLGGRWRRVYVARSLCPSAGAPAEQGDCPERFSPAELAELRDRLTDLRGDVDFVGPDEARDVVDRIFDGRAAGSVLLRVGPLRQEPGGALRVPGSYYCGGLCGGGAVWLVEFTGGRWMVTGSKGGEWIS